MKPSTFESLLVLYARRFPIRRGKLRVIESLWRVAIGERGTRRLAYVKHGNFKMPCDLSEWLQRQYYFFGTYFLEEDILDCWENEAKDAKVIFDVGANGGIFSLAALAAQQDVIVHAFEPTPEIATRLRVTVALNRLDQLHVHEVAVSSKNGYAALRRWRGKLGTNEGMNFITAIPSDSEAELVPTVCLDRFCEEHSIDRIDLLKLDIQGHEHQALVGATNLLSTGRVGTIFFELNWADDAGGPCPATESIRILERAGYRFSKPGKRLDWKKSGNWMQTLRDVVARRVCFEQVD